jgi:formylglycine-generating enzyme required for sulfatase activity
MTTRSSTVGLVGAIFVAAGLAAPSCSAPGKGALVLAVSTDMQTPKDIDVVSIFVSTSGVPKFDYLGRVQPDGTVSLPSTLAIVEPDDDSAQVRIRVIGFQNQAGVENARVLRDVLTTVPHQQTVLLRVALSFLDDGSASGTLPASAVPDSAKGVADGLTQFDPTSLTNIQTTCDFTKNLTMISGECKLDGIDSSTLPAYDGSDVFGDAGLKSDGMPASCFDVARCFAAAAPVANVDTGHCTFTLPPGVDASKVNLALETPTTGACVGPKCFVPLENDAADGWSAKGSAVSMLPGVCKRLTAGATLYQAASTGCAPKAQELPVCQLAEGSDGGTYDAAPDTAPPVDAPVEAGCTPNQTRCSTTLTNTPEQCDDTGTWQPQPACESQACVAGACVGTCAPGSIQCSDRTTPALCDGTGTPVPQTACSGATPYCYLGTCVATYPSCQGGGTGADSMCGVMRSTDCCASLPVTGGAFARDGNGGYPATVADLRLDAFEVTVGRFRKFVAATAPVTGAPWVPTAGSGTHSYLPGGGLINGVLPEAGATEGGAADAAAPDATVEGGADAAAPVPLYETGWDPTWETIPSTQQGWANALVCDASYATWTLSGGSGDALPINCVTWAEAEAFCIWDGGFLPSETEWDYTAAGGSMQQGYPWGTVAPSTNASLAVYGCFYGAATAGSCSGVQNIAPVGSIPAGNQSTWGQSDLAGNLSEWLLDWYSNQYAITPCANCASTAPTTSTRSIRGGAFYDPANDLVTSYRNGLAPSDRGANLGFRCARPPSGAGQ